MTASIYKMDLTCFLEQSCTMRTISQWESVGSLLTARGAHQSFYADGRIYTFGGCIDTECRGYLTNEIFDEDTGSTYRSGSYRRSFFAGVLL